MRDLLAKDEEFKSQFLSILVNGYLKIIVPWYPKKKAANVMIDSIGKNLIDSKYDKKGVE